MPHPPPQMPFWPGDKFSVLADWCTIVGLVLSGIAAGASVSAKNAVQKLEKKYQRRDLLPPSAQKYQVLYAKLVPILSGLTDARPVKHQLGELEGVLNGLDKHFTNQEKITTRQIRHTLKLIKKEPLAPNHLGNLLTELGILSGELDTIIGIVNWNSQSSA